jgi:phage shock protein PspC (stress-responsive transcriptional regulator)
MERVVTINLNGNPYQLEEPAYDALRTYLARADAALAANPDKAEIIRDLEQAIADKCGGFLNPGKSVVSASEMARILDQMGPVEGAPGDVGSEGAEARNEDYVPPRRRLFRVYDQNAWTGVSAGMAAYAGIDVAWVRALWILAAILTGGVTCFIYLALIFAMPVAASAEDLAAAHGAPFNAQEVIERAKREYNRFTDTAAPQWQATWREQQRAWRRQMHEWRRSRRRADFGGGPVSAPPQPVGYATRVIAGVLAFVFSLITAALLIAFLVAFFTVLNTGALFGWMPPFHVPTWLLLVVLAIIYVAISAPFGALRRSSYATVSGYRYDNGHGDGFGIFGIVALAIFLAWIFIPDAREFMQQAVYSVRDFLEYVRDQIRN